jgi:coenzyme PQQ precursor peptide PqqA
MMIPCRLAPVAAEYRGRPNKEDLHMKWETPVAVDLRFGMEITMYVANR